MAIAQFIGPQIVGFWGAVLTKKVLSTAMNVMIFHVTSL